MNRAAGIAIIALVVSGAISLALIAFDVPANGHLIFNSDTLVPANLTWEFLRGDTWRQFQMPRVPSLVPDMMIYGSWQMLTGDWRQAAFIHAIVMLFGLILLGGRTVQAIAPSSFTVALSTFALFALPALWLELAPPALRHRLGITLPVYHSGAFLLSLIGLHTVARYARRPTSLLLACILVLTFAGSASDKLFIAYFSMPAIAAYFAISLQNIRAVIILIITLAIGTILGFQFDLLLNRSPIVLSNPIAAASAFMRSPIDLSLIAPWTFWFAYFLPLAGALAATIFAVRSNFLTTQDENLRKRRIFWLVAAWTSMGGTAAAMSISYVDTESYRYASPLLWFPLILCAAAVSSIAGAFQWIRVAAASLFSLASIAFYLKAGLRPPALLAWRSATEVCIMTNRDAFDLQAGLADYWNARKNFASSDWRLQIDAITPKGNAMYWANSKYWYAHGIHDTARPPQYNFMLVDRLEIATIRNRYGEPDKILNCPISDVWVYSDSDRVRRVLKTLSPDF